MKKKLLSILIIAFSLPAFSGGLRDTLLQAIHKTDNEDSLSIIYSQLSREYRTINLDSAISFAKAGLEIATKNEFIPGIAENMACVADCYVMQDSLEQARSWYRKAGDYFQKEGDDYGLAQTLMVTGNIYLAQNNYSEAMAAYQRCREIADRKGYDEILSNIYNNTGIIYSNTGDMDKALENYFRAKEFSEQYGNYPALSNTLINIASIYQDQGDYRLAKNYLNQALEIMIREGNWVQVAGIFCDLGEIEMAKENYQAASEYFSEGLEYMKEVTGEYLGPRSYVIVEIMMNLGYAKFMTGHTAEAIDELNRAIAMAKENGYLNMIASSNNYLSQVFEQTGKYKNSLECYKIYKQYSDSILNEGNIKKITQLGMQYEFDRNMREKALEQAKKDAAQQKRELVGLVILILVLFIAFVAIALYFLQRSKTRREALERQNLELEKTNLNQELEYKKKELATNVMYLIKKNELITLTAERLTRAKLDFSRENQKLIQFIIRDLLDNTTESIWTEFELRFKEVHSEFYEKLNKLFPDLSSNEKKLCAFLRLNMSTKEISSITYQSVRSINMARFRLRKKLGIDRDENLVSFLEQL